MSNDQFIAILLSIVGFIGILMVTQLIKIADSVKNIHTDLKVLTNDHGNLEKTVNKIEKRIDLIEVSYSKNGVHK